MTQDKMFSDLLVNTISYRKTTKNTRAKNVINKTLDGIKRIHEFERLCDVLRRMKENRATNEYIENNLFTASFKELNKKPAIRFSNNFEKEIKWCFGIFNVYKDVLNDILVLKKQIEELLLIQNFEECHIKLNEFVSIYGVSIWAFECFIYLKEKHIQIEQIDMNEIASCNKFISNIGLFFELKAKQDISFEEYEYIVLKEIERFVEVNGLDYKASYYSYKFSPFSYIYNKENILDILNIEIRGTLIDKYISFLDICDAVLINADLEEYKQIIYKYICLVDGIKDPKYAAIRVAFGLDILKDDANLYCKNLMVLDQYDDCIDECFKLLNENLMNLDAINLCVEALCYKECEIEELYTEHKVYHIIDALVSIYKMDSKYDSKIDYLMKLIYTCSLSTWAKKLYAYVVKNCHSYINPTRKKWVNVIELYTPSIETRLIFCSREQIDRELAEIKKRVSNSVYYEYLFLVYNKKYDKVCELKTGTNHFLSFSYMYEDITDTICDKIGFVSNVNSVFLKLQLTKILFKRIEKLERYDLGIELLVDTYINNDKTWIFLPLIQYAEKAKMLGRKMRKNICIPILLYLVNEYSDKNMSTALSIACEDYMLEYSINKPSLLGEIIDNLDRNRIIFFLSNICRTNVIDSCVNIFRNSEEVDQERIEICQILCDLNPDKNGVYLQEIKELSQKLVINAGLQEIEDSKIHVNTDGIKEKLIKDIRNDYTRFQVFSHDNLDILDNIRSLGLDVQLITNNINADKILTELVAKIRNYFVSSNEYGLDGYLSLNIRHGTLAEHLRSPLVTNKLFSVFDPDKNAYDINDYWTKRVNSVTDKKTISDALGKLMTETENIIDHLKNELIQIHTEDKESLGVFDYSITRYLLFDIRNKLSLATDCEEFIENVFEKLWDMTEVNLGKIKKIINQDISQSYLDAFENLSNSLSSISERDNVSDLQNKINEASTDMQNELAKICYWFKRSTVNKYNDFELDLAFNISIRMIRNIHPNRNFVVKKIIHDTKYADINIEKLPGNTMKNYVDIFYTLLGNIYENAEIKNGNVEIRYQVRANKKQTYIYIENDYNCEKDMSADKQKMTQVRELLETMAYLTRVKKEGGTGIPKIYKILKVDLYKKCNISFGYLEEKNIFFMEIKEN